MAAYYYLCLPTHIFPNSNHSSNDLKEFKGFQKKVDKNCTYYSIPNEMFDNLKDFLWDCWSLIEEKHPQAIDSEWREFYKKSIPQLNFDIKTLPTIEEKLNKLSQNYYFHYQMTIFSFYVYQGWPIDKNIDNMNLFILLISENKYGEDSSDHVMMDRILTSIKSELNDKYPWVKYLRIMAY